MQGGKEKRRDITIHWRELQYTANEHMCHITFPSTHTTQGKEAMSTSGKDDHEAQREDETKKIIQEMREMIGGGNK